VDQLSVAQKQLIEVAKAVALEPRVLILDEPTAPLGADQADILFEQVRRATARGTAVIYITHRLGEVREIADEVTVLRDGRVRGSGTVTSLDDEHLLRMIVGRSLESAFPDKSSVPEVADRATRRDHRAGGHRRQRAERVPARAGRAAALDRPHHAGRYGVAGAGAGAFRGVHARGPAP
jgi:ribose transport system ATP-binding protein